MKVRCCRLFFLKFSTIWSRKDLWLWNLVWIMTGMLEWKCLMWSTLSFCSESGGGVLLMIVDLYCALGLIFIVIEILTSRLLWLQRWRIQIWGHDFYFIWQITFGGSPLASPSPQRFILIGGRTHADAGDFSWLYLMGHCRFAGRLFAAANSALSALSTFPKSALRNIWAGAVAQQSSICCRLFYWGMMMRIFGNRWIAARWRCSFVATHGRFLGWTTAPRLPCVLVWWRSSRSPWDRRALSSLSVLSCVLVLVGNHIVISPFHTCDTRSSLIWHHLLLGLLWRTQCPDWCDSWVPCCQTTSRRSRRLSGWWQSFGTLIRTEKRSLRLDVPKVFIFLLNYLILLLYQLLFVIEQFSQHSHRKVQFLSRFFHYFQPSIFIIQSNLEIKHLLFSFFSYCYHFFNLVFFLL